MHNHYNIHLNTLFRNTIYLRAIYSSICLIVLLYIVAVLKVVQM